MLHERYAADPEYVLRFDREARAVAGLNHPGIVSVLDRGHVDGRQFIVFEYVEGENLKQLVERTGSLPIRHSLELTIQLGQALAFAHAHGVLHRDVKPQNVLLTDGQAKITDFGIARSAHLDELTLTGTVLGTSEYMAPEQANGQQASERSDVYSLGVHTIALRHVREPAPNLLELRLDATPRLAGAVARALEKDPESRFQSMDAVLSELEACRDAIAPADDDSTVALPPPAQAISGQQRRNRRPSNPARTSRRRPPPTRRSSRLLRRQPQQFGHDPEARAASPDSGCASARRHRLRSSARRRGRKQPTAAANCSSQAGCSSGPPWRLGVARATQPDQGGR
jgi:eukaryotic-like serine/threonine-protein kinase